MNRKWVIITEIERTFKQLCMFVRNRALHKQLCMFEKKICQNSEDQTREQVDESHPSTADKFLKNRKNK